MSLADNIRLYDIATRQQIYIEGVKAWQNKKFNVVLIELARELKRILNNVSYDSLDQLTKIELNKLILSLRRVQERIYSDYTKQLIKDLQEFMTVSLDVSRQLWASNLKGADLDFSQSIDFIKDENNNGLLFPLFGLAAATGNNKKLWSTIINAPIPANGIYPIALINGFVKSAQVGVENIVRQGYANRYSVKEVITQLTSTSDLQGTSSQIQRIKPQATAVTATTMQHIAAISAAAVLSALYSHYTWYSVIDNATTSICRSRNLNIYRFGEGPIPPAHFNCRSHIAPIVGNAKPEPESFYSWTLRQPEKIQNAALGKSNAELLRNGEIKAKEITKYEQEVPLSLTEYQNKISDILSN